MAEQKDTEIKEVPQNAVSPERRNFLINRERRLQILQKVAWRTSTEEDSSLTLLNFRMDKNFVEQLQSLSDLRGHESRTDTLRRIVLDSFNTQFIQEVARASLPTLKKIFENVQLKNVELGNPLSKNRDEETLLTFNYQTTQLRFNLPYKSYWCKTKFYRSDFQDLLFTLDMNKPSEMNTELYLPKIITGLEVDPLILERVFSLAAKHKIAIQSNPISMSEGKPTQGKELPPLLTFDLINRFTINPCSKDWKQILENECQKFKNFLNEYVKFLETQPNIIKLENQEELGISLMKQVDKYAKKHDKEFSKRGKKKKS